MALAWCKDRCTCPSYKIKLKDCRCELALGSHSELPQSIHLALQQVSMPEALIQLIGQYLPTFRGHIRRHVNKTLVPGNYTFNQQYLVIIRFPDSDEEEERMERGWLRLFLYSWADTSWSLQVFPFHFQEAGMVRPTFRFVWNTGNRLLILGYWHNILQTRAWVFQLHTQSAIGDYSNGFQVEHEAEGYLPHPDEVDKDVWFVLRTFQGWFKFSPFLSPRIYWTPIYDTCLFLSHQPRNFEKDQWWTPQQHPWAPLLRELEESHLTRFLAQDPPSSLDKAQIVRLLDPKKGICLTKSEYSWKKWYITCGQKILWVFPCQWHFVCVNTSGEWVFHVGRQEWWAVDPWQGTKRKMEHGWEIEELYQGTDWQGEECPCDHTVLWNTREEGLWLLE